MSLNPVYLSQAALGKEQLITQLENRSTDFYKFYKTSIVKLHQALRLVVKNVEDCTLWPAFSLKKIKLFKGETLTDLVLANSIVLALEYCKLTPGTILQDKVLEYYSELSTKRVSLASPFFNNLRKQGDVNLSSCFVMELGDSLESIMKHVTYCARISKAGGGSGVYMGKVRGKGANIGHNKNAASSVMAWIRLFDQVCVSVNQLGHRPGAITVALPIWHIDIEEFLNCQTENGDLRAKAYNIQPQVCIDNNFMEAVLDNLNYALYCPKDLADNNIDPSKDREWHTRAEKLGLVKKEVRARKLWVEVQEKQRTVGRPYIFFTDNAQVNTPFKNYGNINSANLCCFGKETLIKTKEGDIAIEALAGTLDKPNFHQVWNGINYANAPVYKVAENQTLYRVHFTQGQYVDVTSDHNFWIATEANRNNEEPDSMLTLYKVQTSDLKKGMRLPKVWMPGTTKLSDNYILKIEPLFGAHTVYCLTEPLRNMVIANGVPVSQCESYSYFEAEKYIHCCNLISINLAEHQSLETIAKSTAIATEMADLSLNLGFIDIPEAQSHIKDFRTIGIGMMGLADWLAYNQSYYSDLTLIEKTQKAITKAAYAQSVMLASMWGSCAAYSSLSSDLWDKLDLEPDFKSVKEMRSTSGIRNSMMIATAPNTSTSLTMGATASFLPPYELEFVDESEDHNLQVVTKYEPSLYLTNQQVPQEFITDCTAVMQKWTDAGISMEYLLPEGASWSTNERFSQNKVSAWKQGVKAVYYCRATEQGASLSEGSEASSLRKPEVGGYCSACAN